MRSMLLAGLFAAPILMQALRNSGRLRPGTRSLLAGFGVGFSWAGCMWT